ncbi:MAG: choice-of-anchor D domain-containing protein, partial [Nitrospirae bacterium]|nr:choice-of-anchor D domain-containing protein [Nitrospirota bacterium]
MSSREVVLTGSVAFDYLMHFPGRFREHILPDHLDSLSLSFLVDSLEKRPGGIAANIAYSMALLGERPRVMATVGEDFEEYRQSLQSVGVVTDDIKVIPGLLTASFFVTTDETDAQIASFYTGAMAHASELKFADLESPPDLVMISPNDPDAMIAYANECVELGIRYLYDPSQQILRLDSSTLEEGIRGCEALFANEYELALIEDKTSLTIDDITELTKFTVTWDAVPEFEVSNTNTVQLVLNDDGSFQITYNGVDIVTPSNGSLLVGFNSGRANPLTQSVDFTNVPINGGSNDFLFEFFGPPAPTISLSPDPLNFGDVNSGDTLSMQLSITNSGSAALDVTNITVSNSDFSVASPTSFQVSAGSTLNKTISFNPTSTGAKSATLTVTNNSSNQQTATIALGGIGITPPVYSVISEFKITASDGAVNDNFGSSVSISGDYAVVGAMGDDDNGTDAGSAYVFKRTGTSWAQEAKLLASDGAADDR